MRAAPLRRWRLWGVILAVSAVVSACAVAPRVERAGSGPWTARQAALSAYPAWALAGRIGVTTEQEGWHASLAWSQQGPDYSIDLTGPLGQGRVQIRGDEASVSVQTQDGRRLSAADPEQVLEEAVGVRVPLRGLVYWVRGLPNPARPSVLRGDEQGRLAHLEQDGWSIDYPRYEQVGDLEMPARINARRGDLQVRVAISQWTLQP